MRVTAQITIGHESSGKPVEFDIEELLATRLLVQGNSGSGKSHLIRRLLEESAGMVQQVVIDPEGDFPSLAEEFGHVVIDGSAYSPGEIEALARRIREHRASVVLDLDGLEVEQQIRCAAQFLTALFDAPREHWYPALVVVDEAQMFAPAAAGEVAEDTRRMTMTAMTNLMCRGRKRGLAGIVAERIGPEGVLLFPSYTRTAPRHGRPILTPIDWVYTAVFNALELPVTQVPLGLDHRGLPLGVQVVGCHGQDHVTIAAAQRLEAELGGWIPPWTVGQP